MSTTSTTSTTTTTTVHLFGRHPDDARKAGVSPLVRRTVPVYRAPATRGPVLLQRGETVNLSRLASHLA